MPWIKEGRETLRVFWSWQGSTQRRTLHGSVSYGMFWLDRVAGPIGVGSSFSFERSLEMSTSSLKLSTSTTGSPSTIFEHWKRTISLPHRENAMADSTFYLRR